MLAFKFQLTPAQVDFLLVCYAGRYRRMEKSTGLLPDFDSSWFVSIARRLIAHGLLEHDNNRSPTYLITDKGKAVAQMIVDDAKRIAAHKFAEVTPASKPDDVRIGGKKVKVG